MFVVVEAHKLINITYLPLEVGRSVIILSLQHRRFIMSMTSFTRREMFFSTATCTARQHSIEHIYHATHKDITSTQSDRDRSHAQEWGRVEQRGVQCSVSAVAVACACVPAEGPEDPIMRKRAAYVTIST